MIEGIYTLGSAFKILSDMEASYRTSAIGWSEGKAATQGWLGIGMYVLGRALAVPLQEIAEIVRYPLLTELPRAATWFKGMSQVRGRLLPITDLQGFLEGTTLEENHKNRVLIVQNEGALSGFLVRNLTALQRFHVTTNQEEHSSKLNKDFQYMIGKATSESGEWEILSLQAVVNSEKFKRVAQL